MRERERVRERERESEREFDTKKYKTYSPETNTSDDYVCLTIIPSFIVIENKICCHIIITLLK